VTPWTVAHGISQARILQWVVISFSRGTSQPIDRTRVSHIEGRRFTTKPPGKPIKGNLGKLKIKIEETGIYGRYIGFLALTY